MRLQRDPSPFRSVTSAVDGSGRYQPVSYWQETIGVVPGAPLSASIECDVAIVGGGFTGLSMAIALKESAPDLHIVVVELGVAGHGASGRNGGFAMPLIGWDLSAAAKSLGEQTAQQAYQLMYEAVDYFKASIARHKIDCDLECTGYLLLATCPRRKARIHHEVELGRRLGFDLEWLEGDALKEHIRSDTFLGGAFDPHPAIVNPAKLARGLKAAAEALGVDVYEQTPIEHVREGQIIEAGTPEGSVRARHLVLATNGYSGALGFMKARVMPVHTYIVLTEPLSDGDLDAIGWGAKRTSLETGRNFIHYFRLTADNRVLFGGEDVALYYGGRYEDRNAQICARLEARFREYFPQLGHVAVSHRWGGVLGVTLDMFPTFGVNGSHENIWHAMGYSGHGVSLSNFAGTLLAPHILEKGFGRKQDAALESPFFYNRRPMWLPPDPLRFAGLQAYRHALRLMDVVEGA